MTQHVFVATDGSDAAMKAVGLAAEIAARFDLPLSVGHVLRFGRSVEELARMADVEHIVRNVSRSSTIDFQIMTGTTGDLVADTRPSGDVVRVITLIGEEILQRAADRARELGVKQVNKVSTQGDPADAILDMASDAGADMIVVGHRGLGRVRTMLLGSVAQKIVQNAECTVVSVR